MADLKISQLTSATTPLAGTEQVPLVQSSTTKKTTVNDLMQAQFAANIVTETTTSRTLSASDMQKIIYCTSASATTITCATGLGAGFNVTIIQGGAGKVTVAAGAATLVSYSSLFSTMGQYAVISLIAPVANTFVAAGNLGV
jgi:hypothetical protein